MKRLTLSFLTGVLMLVGNTLMAQTPGPTPTPAPGLPPNSSNTMVKNCPGNTAPCQGDCIFTITISSQSDTNCANNRVDVNLQANSTGSGCVADFNRSDGGAINFTLCSGEECVVDENVFSDTTFWPPYYEGDGRPKKPGKDSLSVECARAIGLTGSSGTGGPPYQLLTYRFTGVSSVNPDFGMEALCYCEGDTVRDTIVVEVDTVKAVVVEDEVDNSDEPGGDVRDGTGRKNGNFVEMDAFSVTNIYPNPATDELNVVFQTRSSSTVQVIVHDQMGQQVWRSLEMLNAGDNTFTLDVRELRGGFYFMTLIGENDQKQVVKFIHR